MEPERLIRATPSAVMCMNSSREGKTSYANNSGMQRAIASVTKKARQDMAAALYRSNGCSASMAIADLGCATGPNALLLVSDAVEAVLAAVKGGADDGGQLPPELHVFLNDLPDNDFNAIFRLLPSSPLAASGCLVSAWPGSYYGRIFPEASLDYVVSSSSLHWLSKAPTIKKTVSSGEHLNRGRRRVYVAASAGNSALVLDAYRAQFQTDFSTFLGCRAAEMRPRGLLLLTFLARRTACPAEHDSYLWDVLADALMDMVAAGLIDEERVHAFNLPMYTPCPDDLLDVVSKEGSFTVNTMQFYQFSPLKTILQFAQDKDEGELPQRLAVEVADCVRAFLEPTLQVHFGRAATDELFCRYRLLLEAYYRNEATRNKDDITNAFLVLEKKLNNTS